MSTIKPEKSEAPKVDLSSMKVGELKNLNSVALKGAIDSVLRNEKMSLSHRDHGSHANSNA